MDKESRLNSHPYFSSKVYLAMQEVLEDWRRFCLESLAKTQCHNQEALVRISGDQAVVRFIDWMLGDGLKQRILEKLEGNE